MTRRADQIGISQRVRLEWLEKTANLILAGNEKTTVKDALEELLQDKISIGSHAERGNREKTITILLKTWSAAPKELEHLRTEGLELLRSVPRCDHMVIHWGMLMAVYPFWSYVAAQTGRLLRLQGSAAVHQVQRRVRERYGERDTVSRATRRVLRSYYDWGVLQITDLKGVYSADTLLTIDNIRLIAWLVEASLQTRESSSASLKDLLDNPSLFPFRIKPVSDVSILASSSSLDLLQQGLDDNLVLLRNWKA